MIDTSVLVAGLVEAHEFHDLARPHVVAAATGIVPGIVVAEAWAVLRAGPFNLDADTVQQALAPWADVERLAVTPADGPDRGAGIDIGGGGLAGRSQAMPRTTAPSGVRWRPGPLPHAVGVRAPVARSPRRGGLTTQLSSPTSTSPPDQSRRNGWATRAGGAAAGSRSGARTEVWA